MNAGLQDRGVGPPLKTLDRPYSSAAYCPSLLLLPCTEGSLQCRALVRPAGTTRRTHTGQQCVYTWRSSPHTCQQCVHMWRSTHTHTLHGVPSSRQWLSECAACLKMSHLPHIPQDVTHTTRCHTYHKMSHIPHIHTCKACKTPKPCPLLALGSSSAAPHSPPPPHLHKTHPHSYSSVTVYPNASHVSTPTHLRVPAAVPSS
jgi:hypothetical protein